MVTIPGVDFQLPYNVLILGLITGLRIGRNQLYRSHSIINSMRDVAAVHLSRGLQMASNCGIESIVTTAGQIQAHDAQGNNHEH